MFRGICKVVLKKLKFVQYSGTDLLNQKFYNKKIFLKFTREKEPKLTHWVG